MPPKEVRGITPSEALDLDWISPTNLEGQFRGTEELHSLAQNIISLLEDPESGGIVVLPYDNAGEAFFERGRIKNAVERLSRRKVQTRKIDQYNQDRHLIGSKLYFRFKPLKNPSK